MQGIAVEDEQNETNDHKGKKRNRKREEKGKAPRPLSDIYSVLLSHFTFNP
jgi:hypothetical protein